MSKKEAKEILIEALNELQKGRIASNPGIASVLIFSALTGYFGLSYELGSLASNCGDTRSPRYEFYRAIANLIEQQAKEIEELRDKVKIMAQQPLTTNSDLVKLQQYEKLKAENERLRRRLKECVLLLEAEYGLDNWRVEESKTLLEPKHET